MAQANAKVKISNELGFHARPAMAFADTANRFKADILVRKGEQVVDGKSIMQLMMLAAGCDTELEITADGDDADDAVQQLAQLVARQFDET